MSLKTKIGLSFFISASIIAILSVFEFISFIQIKGEIRSLEITDTIRSKSLQIRRHEKNFFLYPLQAKEEAEAIKRYIGELNEILRANVLLGESRELLSARMLVNDYDKRLQRIKYLLVGITEDFNKEKISHGNLSDFFPLIEASFYEQPLRGARILKKIFSLQPDHPLINKLEELDSEINQLRKTGEDLISVSRDLDKVTRDDVDNLIAISQAALTISLILFFISGIVTLFLINRNVVNRLKLLIGIIGRTGKGQFPQITIPMGKWDNDEVGMLISEFNTMEEKLSDREHELNTKNRELLQSKKLAAIGTLAAGVAHELNNPLNNIYLSVQVLKRTAGETCPPSVSEIIDDIKTQTARVKHIVGDLLEFARGKDPDFRKVEIKGLLAKAFKSLGSTLDLDKIIFSVDSDRDEILINADQDQLQQVFINLFHNAVEAMSGEGELRVGIESVGESVRINVSDTGNGIPRDALDKIFEPFFTTKDKGTGLGLAIIFNIIQKHGGNISAESEPGKWTNFRITLPKSEGTN
jgi:two-component system NtrC family sensor kinase